MATFSPPPPDTLPDGPGGWRAEVRGRPLQRLDRRGRRTLLFLISAGLHVAVLALLAFGGAEPVYRIFREPAAVRIELVRPPRQVDTRAPVKPQPAQENQAAQSAPIQARAAAPQPNAPAMAPSPIPAAPVPGGAGQPGRIGTAPHPGPLPAAGADGVKSALRGSTGCLSPDAVGLNRDERDRCDERLGAGVKTARQFDAPMDGRKRRDLDRQAAGQDSYRRYKQAPVSGGGVDTRGGGPNGPPKEIPWP